MVDALTTQVPLSLPSWGLIIFAVAAAVGVLPKSERLLRGLTTYVHEMGHALTAIVLGRRVTAIKVDSWLGGHTAYVGKRNIANILVSWAGYAAPGSLLLLVSFTYFTGLTALVGAISAIALVASLALQRSVFGISITLLFIVFFALIYYQPESTISASIIFLLLGGLAGNGVSAVFLLKNVRRSAKIQSPHDNQLTDSEYLRKATLVPARIWEYSWLFFILSTIIIFTVVILLIQ